MKATSSLSRIEGWPEDPLHEHWASPLVTERILGVSPAGKAIVIPKDWTHVCARRVRELRDVLRGSWVGLDFTSRGQGHLTDWVLAFLIARESGLLLGGPGTAKTEIAERTYSLLGLAAPVISDLPSLPADEEEVHDWWLKREDAERRHQKFFSYLLSRFTQPDEIFGPIEISLLRRGMLVRVNFGMLTGPGVRAAFLDEVFKASSSILNSMLRLILNREHFNWGGMRRSDLLMFIGASNELPGGLGSGTVGIGANGEDFATLYAFLDRFPIRLEVPAASGKSTAKSVERSDLALATRMAIDREAAKFQTNELFAQLTWDDRAPCLNDLVLLGRAMMQRSAGHEAIFDKKAVTPIDTLFYRIAADLQQDGTGIHEQRVSWTISPRKLKALWKVALAHAIVRDDSFASGTPVVEGPVPADLRVFDWIWDTPTRRDELEERVRFFVH